MVEYNEPWKPHDDLVKTIQVLYYTFKETKDMLRYKMQLAAIGDNQELFTKYMREYNKLVTITETAPEPNLEDEKIQEDIKELLGK